MDDTSTLSLIELTSHRPFKVARRGVGHSSKLLSTRKPPALWLRARQSAVTSHSDSDALPLGSRVPRWTRYLYERCTPACLFAVGGWWAVPVARSRSQRAYVISGRLQLPVGERTTGTRHASEGGEGAPRERLTFQGARVWEAGEL